ncbi:MAG: hypothetical protein ACT4QF_10660 [Sporichthyaceae bacterium]
MDDDMHDEMDEYLEQYSPASAQALTESVERLVEGLRAWAAQAVAMRGGDAELAGLFDRNDRLAAMVEEFNDAAGNHTGTLVLALAGLEDDFDLDLEDDEEDDDVPLQSQLCVVSRWDLELVDRDALIAAGRAAHLRENPRSTAEDAEVAVWDASSAIAAITCGTGEVWFGIPGLRPMGGARVGIAPDESLAPLPDDPELIDYLVPPSGVCILSESWVC